MRVFLIFVIATLFSLTNTAFAQDGKPILEHVWTIGKISGKAWIKSEETEPVLVKLHQKFNPGQSLITGPQTRVQLKRNKERIQVGSDSELALPGLNTVESGKTIIKHTRGTLHLVVSKKDVRHFSVETPFLVAAVKGTQFTVTIGEKVTDVRVHEGLVAVKDKRTKQTIDVRPGQLVELKTTSSSAKDANSLIFVDRGEEHPDVIAERAREKARAQKWGQLIIISDLVDMVVDYVSEAMLFVKQSFDHMVTIILDLIKPLLVALGASFDADSVRKWTGLVVSAIAVGLLIGVGAAYFAVRRRDR